MAHTILVVAIGWLALDVVIFGLLLLAGSARARRAPPRPDVIEALFAACPYAGSPDPRPRRRERFRPRTGGQPRPVLTAVPTGATLDEPS